MQVFNLKTEQAWDPGKHVEKILAEVGGGDASVACWEPGQISPYHCHPRATEIYFCFEGGGQMRTQRERVEVAPGAFVVHPPGELHEYINGPARTLLFRVRYGSDMAAHHLDWRGNPAWRQSAADAAYFRAHPPGRRAICDPLACRVQDNMSEDIMAKAYWVSAYRSISNPDAVAEYAKLAGPAILAAGGKFLARGNAAVAYESGMKARIVVIEFPSVEAAKACHDGPGYQAALKVFNNAGVRDFRIVEGLE